MSVLLKELTGEGVLTLTLNRPKARNAIDAELRAALQQAFEEASEDAAVRAVVLSGAEGHFCAGGDLASMRDLSPEAARERLSDVSRTALTIAACEKPVIAAVEGHAAGAGVGLALLCDRVIAGVGAVFTLSFAKVGLAPDWGLTLTLPQRVGRAEARRLAWEAGRLEAAEALAMGLADELTEAGALDRARDFATRLADGPAPAIAAIKGHFRQSPGLLAEALEREARAQLACFASPEFAEGLAAFSEKRRPDFRRTR
jgi:2-(1,2-epoxy-1,2-dihydrophenyl)acetyl-CoA isomerase